MDSLPALIDPPQFLALAAALGFASGFRLYAAVFFTGLAGFMGWVELPAGLHVLEHPAVLGASGFMLFVEFFADKIPYVDSVWDAAHTLIRIPAGAALAAGALGADSTAMAWIAALVGGGLAATSHATKMTARAAVNTSPEPFSNVAVSLFEDGWVLFLLWLSATHPAIFTVVLVASVVAAIVLLVVLVKFLQAAVRELRDFFAGRRLPK
ncbi:DUF4126 domain-containing protein [Ramlibacter sp.]|uniref:DUF4126 domain-containing protein n=1 Tax=Ramlibacter sp. TaxID=1917967 RepID=UPI002FCCA3B8